jgi:hypothetical protein
VSREEALERLEELANLRRQGALTADEFEDSKRTLMAEAFPWPPPPGGGRFAPYERVRVRKLAIETSFDDVGARLVHDHFKLCDEGTIQPEIGWSYVQAVVKFDSCGERHNIHVDNLERVRR